MTFPDPTPGCDIFCPEPANLADISLQLEQTALQAEACIFDKERLLRSAVNKPTIIVVSGAPQVLGTVATPLTTAYSPLYTNIGWNIYNSPAGAVPTWNNVAQMGGVWLVGVALNATAVGAVTDNSARSLFINTITDVIGTGTTQAIETLFEPNVGGGVDMSLTTVINTTQSVDQFQAVFFHNNVASNVTIAAGAIFWATRLGDSQIVKVV